MKIEIKIRQALRLFSLLLLANTVVAAPCAQIRSNSQVWVNASINSLIRSARAAFDDDEALPAYTRVVNGITRRLELCKLTDDENFSSRYSEFLQYVSALNLVVRSDHELGFLVPDQQYFEEAAQYVEIPSFLLDQKFLRAVSRYETLNEAKSYIRSLNAQRGADEQLIFFSYESRHLGTPDNDNSFRRLLIVVPGDPNSGVPEKWVQFGITDPGVRRRTRNVSVVAALPGLREGPNVYFKDFFRTYRRNGNISVVGRWELGYGDDNCVQCHKSGILPVFPEAGSVARDEEPALLEVNRRFRSYGPARFEKYRDEIDFGPGLSAASESDRQQRFGQFLSPRIKAAMNCGSCHMKGGLGTFNWPMDQVLLSSFIKGGKMPFGSDLKAEERDELYNRLIEEYFSTDETAPGILKSWLLGKRR